MTPQLDSYIEQFANLRTDKARTRWDERTNFRAPHQPLLLLSVMDQIAEEVVTNNRIELTSDLMDRFDTYWSIVRPMGREQGDIVMPFFHLDRRDFWHLIARPGREFHLENVSRIRSLRKLQDTVRWAKLDDALFKLLRSESSREILRRVLVETYFAPELQQDLM